MPLNAPPPPTAFSRSNVGSAKGAPAKKGGLGLSRATSVVDHEDDFDPTIVTPVAQKPQEESVFAEVSGRVTKVIYRTPDGYSVYAVRGADGTDTTVAANGGTLADKGDKIIAKGQWSTYKGRDTFKAVLVTLEIPKGARGIVTWLKTKPAAGVGIATATKIAKHFGDELPDVVGDPQRLIEAGIPLDKAQSIADAWNSNASQPELVEFLGRFGLGEMTIAKIVRRYGAAARRIVRDNPWQLAQTILGVGFQTADNLAKEAGHKPDSEKRILAGICYGIEQKTGREGHCGLTWDEIFIEASQLLNLPIDLISTMKEQALGTQTITEDGVTGLVYPNGLYLAETSLAERLTALAKNGHRHPEDVARQAVEQAVKELGVNRDEGQIEAAVMAVTNPLAIITGGPGTGKSTTQRVIVRALSHLERVVVLAAPTGRAAKRLAEVSGMPASTCHRLLSFSAEKGGFVYDANNPFEEDHIIIDEFSMVDVRLGQSFMDAVKKTGAVTIVGDVDQLPSVGAGQVLKDLIDAGTIPVARLKTVHRQQGDSGIVVAAARINEGQSPITPGEDLNGFDLRSAYKEVGSPFALRKTVVSIMSEELPALGFDPLTDVQVLSPMRKGDLGILKLNEDLKDALNPATKSKSIEIRKRVFSVGDRVMHLRNDYVKKVYNGEVGTVTYVGMRKDEDGNDVPFIQVEYSGYMAFYNPTDINDVELSWAATVHKSQGCEFPVVIFVCPDAHRRMLTRNLLYTAVTRAKKLCIVVGQHGALNHAVNTADTNRRYTGLAKRLEGISFDETRQMAFL